MAMSDDNSSYRPLRHQGSQGGATGENYDPLGQNQGFGDFQSPPNSEFSPDPNLDQQSGHVQPNQDFVQNSPVNTDYQQTPLAPLAQQPQPTITSDYLAAQQQALANQLALQGNSSQYQDPFSQENFGASAQDPRGPNRDPLLTQQRQIEEPVYQTSNNIGLNNPGKSEFGALTQEPTLAQTLDASFDSTSDQSAQYARHGGNDRLTLGQETHGNTYHQQSEFRPPEGGYGGTDHVADYLSERRSSNASFNRQDQPYDTNPSYSGNSGQQYTTPTEPNIDVFGSSAQKHTQAQSAGQLTVPNGDNFAGAGAQPNSLEPSYGDSSYFEEEPSLDASYYEGENTLENYQASAPRRPRRLFLGSIAASILVIGGGAVFAYTNGMLELPFTAEISGGAPVIRASNEPVKEKPVSSGGRQFANKNKLIYDRLQGKKRGGQQKEKLVSRQENVLETTRTSAGIVVTGSNGMQNKSALSDLRGTLNNSVDQASSRTASISNSSSNSQQAPRKVRTLIVRPDGTVLKPAESGASSLNSVSQPKLVSGSESGVKKDTGQPELAKSRTAVSSSLPARKPTTNTRARRDRQTTAVLGKKVASLSPGTSNQASKTVAKPAPKPVQASSNSKYAIQVASSKSQTDALATFANLQQKYSSLLGNYRPLIERVNLGSKGVWYRLRIGPVIRKADASRLCLKLKNSGLKSGCIIRKI